MHYGIQNERSTYKTKVFSRAFFPVLMAINLSSMFLTPMVISFILESDLVNEIGLVSKVPVLTRFLAQIILLTIMFGLAAFLFSPVWFLKDSGIIYSNREKLVNSDEKFVLKSIGVWFQTMLRSYAGIGAIITYIAIIYGFLADFNKEAGKVVILSTSEDKIATGSGLIAELVCENIDSASLSEIKLVK